jgi:hypothetical protein
MKNNEQEKPGEAPGENLSSDRREIMQKLGRFAIYAAPFTILAAAKGGTGGGSSVGNMSKGARR